MWVRRKDSLMDWFSIYTSIYYSISTDRLYIVYTLRSDCWRKAWVTSRRRANTWHIYVIWLISWSCLRSIWTGEKGISFQIALHDHHARHMMIIWRAHDRERENRSGHTVLCAGPTPPRGSATSTECSPLHSPPGTRSRNHSHHTRVREMVQWELVA